jgi:hypothetical protein
LNDYGVGAYYARKKSLLSKNILLRKEKSEKFMFLSEDYIKNKIFQTKVNLSFFGSDGRNLHGESRKQASKLNI